MIFKILKQIPNDLLVLDNDNENDERIEFILNKYHEFKDEGYDLITLTPNTTFKELKESLNNEVKAIELLEFLNEYKETFIDKSNKESKGINYKRIALIAIFGLVFLIVITTLVYGVLKQDLSSTAIIEAFFDLLKVLLGPVVGSPDPF